MARIDDIRPAERRKLWLFVKAEQEKLPSPPSAAAAPKKATKAKKKKIGLAAKRKAKARGEVTLTAEEKLEAETTTYLAGLAIMFNANLPVGPFSEIVAHLYDAEHARPLRFSRTPTMQISKTKYLEFEMR